MSFRAVLAVVGVVVLVGCSDGAVEPIEDAPYEVTTLRTLQEGMEATFGDLNENGQALWHEGEQAVLWDQGNALEVPVGKFLGSAGEVLGDSSMWRDGEIVQFATFRTLGITEEGTVYLSRGYPSHDDTVFTWREGVLESTTRRMGWLVGPEGRLWKNRANPNDDPNVMYDESECGFYSRGEWHTVVVAGACSVIMAEGNGWAIVYDAGGTNPGRYVVNSDPREYYGVGSREEPLSQATIVHVNSHGHSVTEDGFLAKGSEDKTDLWGHFDSLRPGAINDDGEILAQLDNEVVLLTPR